MSAKAIFKLFLILNALYGRVGIAGSTAPQEHKCRHALSLCEEVVKAQDTQIGHLKADLAASQDKLASVPSQSFIGSPVGLTLVVVAGVLLGAFIGQRIAK